MKSRKILSAQALPFYLLQNNDCADKIVEGDVLAKYHNANAEGEETNAPVKNR